MKDLKKLDKNTFGDTPASISLVKILQEMDNSVLSRKVGSSLNNWNILLRGLKVDETARQSLYLVLRKTIPTWVEGSIGDNPKIGSHMKAIMTYRLRKKLLKVVSQNRPKAA